MKANGLALFHRRALALRRRRLSFSAVDGEEPVVYADNQLLEHILPPRPQTNDLKSAFRQALSEATDSGLGEEEARLQLRRPCWSWTANRAAPPSSRGSKPRHAPRGRTGVRALERPGERPRREPRAARTRRARRHAKARATRDGVLLRSRQEKDDGRRFTRTLNAIRVIASSGRFSPLVEKRFQEGAHRLLGGLPPIPRRRRLHEHAHRPHARRAGGRHARHRSCGSGEAYRSCLTARVEIMGYLLAVALCGAEGVDALARSCGTRRHSHALHPARRKRGQSGA